MRARSFWASQINPASDGNRAGGDPATRPHRAPIELQALDMPTMPTLLRPGGKSKQQAERITDRLRGSAAERGYDAAWTKASAAFRQANPLCEYCLVDGRTAAAVLTDHLYPHRTFVGVFWEQCWWVAACTACHSGMKQAAERQGKPALDALAIRLGRPVLKAGGWAKV
jgi:hypothetical protein